MANHKYTLVLVKHAQSEYNRDGKHSGWYDVDLTDKGVLQAKYIGQLLSSNGYTFDVAFTSLLKRTIKTLFWIQDEMDLHWIPVHKHWRLNERHCGSLQGNVREKPRLLTAPFNALTPPLETTDSRWEALISDNKYKPLSPDVVPASESSKSALDRFMVYWHDTIVPVIKSGKKIILVCHGNILRSLTKELHNIPDNEFEHVESVRRGYPLVYELDENIRPLKCYYLESFGGRDNL